MSTGAPLEKGVSIRYPSTALLCVDSNDGAQYNKLGVRIETSNPSEMYINKQRPLLAGYMTRLALTEANLQWNIPNVNANNNTLTVALWDNAGVNTDCIQVMVPEGFYTLPYLCSVLQNSLNTNASVIAEGKSFEVSFGGIATTGTAGDTLEISSQFNVTINLSTASPGYFTIIPSTASRFAAPTPSGFLPTGQPVQKDDLTYMLGLIPSTDGSFLYYSTFTGGYASCMYTPYVDIESNILTKNQNVQDGSTATQSYSNKLARIYLSQEAIIPRVVSVTYDSAGTIAAEGSSDNAIGVKPFVLYRQFTFPKQIQWNNTENVDVIDLRLLDYRGNTLPISGQLSYVVTGGGGERNLTLSAPSDFQFTLQATEV